MTLTRGNAEPDAWSPAVLDLAPGPVRDRLDASAPRRLLLEGDPIPHVRLVAAHDGQASVVASLDDRAVHRSDRSFRLVALRTAAVTALRERPSFDEAVKVTLEVHVGPRNDRSIGDLDNYITGVLDGLQKAHPATPWQDTPTWTGAPASIRPDQHAGLVDDVHVVEIVARKRVGTTDDPWYKIAITTFARS